MTKALIDIVDMQVDFVEPSAALPVPGADKIVSPYEAFLLALNKQPGKARAILFKYDTHFADEYRQSEEKLKTGFPDHCFWNTRGQRPVIAVGYEVGAQSPITPGIIPVYHMNKNEFSMWQHNGLPKDRVKFSSPEEERAYDNLFKVTSFFNDLTPGTPRDEWLDTLGVAKDVPVVMAGVASDFCVNWAIDGYLKRGHQVTLLTDLTAGIGGEHSPVASGTIEDVAKTVYGEAYAKGQLRLMTSQQWLAHN
jgi:nicotinamidase/pyrazinamidase